MEILYHKIVNISTAKAFPFAPTVHKDVTERLERENKELYERVRAVLDKNKAERHMRGGEATKQKYIDMRVMIPSQSTV